MSELNALAARGVKHLLVRQAALQVLTFAAGIVLARTLSPAEFGLFFIATFLVFAFALAADFGLAASLVQRREELTDRDLQVAFTLQQVLIGAAVVALWLAAPRLTGIYPDAPPETIWLVRALAAGLYLTAWRSISVLQLERRLRFGRVAWIEVAEALVYYGAAVGLAVSGHGVWSFVWATIARGVVGTALAFAAAPWPVRLAVDRKIAPGLLRFGIPFQLQAVSNQLGSWIIPVLVGLLAGPAAVGLLGWASANARKPLLLVDSAMRVAFPHLSRLQDDARELERVLGRYLAYLLVPSGLWLAVIGVAGPSLVPLIYTEKWSPAVPALILYAAALVADVFSWVAAIGLNARGRVGYVTRVTLIRGVVFIGASVPLVLAVGYNGVPMAYLLTGLAGIPFYARGYGRGWLRRTTAGLAWIAAPTAAGAAAGLLVLAAPLDGAAQPILSCLAVVSAFALAAWRLCPAELRPSRPRPTPAPAPVVAD